MNSTIVLKKQINPGMRGTLAVPIDLDKNGNISKLTNSYICREQVIAEFTNLLLAKNKFTRALVKTLDKSRLIIFSLTDNQMREKLIEKMLTPVRVIEKEVGLPRTIVKQIVNEENEPYNALMFEGSVKWYRSSHTMSLWMLLIRMCVRNPNIFYGKNFEELCKRAASFPKGPGSSGSNWVAEDKGYCRDTIHTWIPLMKNVNTIFPPSVKWTTRYDMNKVHKSTSKNGYVAQPYAEGISRLAGNISTHVGQKKFNEIMKDTHDNISDTRRIKSAKDSG